MPDCVAAWIFSIASGFSWTWPFARQAPGSGLTPAAVFCALRATETPVESGIGRSGVTSLTAGSARRLAASAGETVADMALISEKLLMFSACVCLSWETTPRWSDVTSARRTDTFLTVSGTLLS